MQTLVSRLAALVLVVAGPAGAQLSQQKPVPAPPAPVSAATPTAATAAATPSVVASPIVTVDTALARRLAALPFQPGERLSYQLKFGFIGVGSGSIFVAQVDTLRGRDVWRLRFTVTGGIPGFRLNDVMESWFDPARLLSLRFTQELNEGSKHYSRQFDFYPERRVLFERGVGENGSVAEPLDDAAFLYFVRTRPLEVGKSYDFAQYFRPDKNPVTLRVLRKERVSVPAGTFDAIVVQPVFKTNGIFSEGGRAEVWLADDSTRKVVQIKTRLSFGSLNLYLTRIEHSVH